MKWWWRMKWAVARRALRGTEKEKRSHLETVRRRQAELERRAGRLEANMARLREEAANLRREHGRSA